MKGGFAAGGGEKERIQERKVVVVVDLMAGALQSLDLRERPPHESAQAGR